MVVEYGLMPKLIVDCLLKFNFFTVNYCSMLQYNINFNQQTNQFSTVVNIQYHIVLNPCSLNELWL